MGTGNAATITGLGLAPDLIIDRRYNGAYTSSNYWWNRVLGTNVALVSDTTDTTTNYTGSLSTFNMGGFQVGTSATTNPSSIPVINWCFRRAIGVFDIICYTAGATRGNQPHGLGVVPELIIIKSRNVVDSWYVGCSANLTKGSFGAWQADLILNSSAASVPGYNSLVSSDSNITSTSLNNIYGFAYNSYVAYLFATKAGISKVGNYVGNGSTQTISCNFTTGARFVLIKRTDSVGDWFVWDIARGITAGSDPHLSLNTTVAEVVTDDSIDYASTGFVVNQVATVDINVTSASYIFLAFA